MKMFTPFLSWNILLLLISAVAAFPTDTDSFSGDNTLIVTVTFNQSTYNVNEDCGPAQPVLVLSGPYPNPLTVQVFTTDESAIGGGVDYDSGPYNVTFSAGMTSILFDVTINDDDVLENNESYMLFIMMDDSFPDGVTVGNAGSATITILDNDQNTQHKDDSSCDCGGQITGISIVTVLLMVALVCIVGLVVWNVQLNKKIIQLQSQKQSLASKTTAESAYELMDITGDVNMDKNPAYSVIGVQDSSEDHHYESIPVNNRYTKARK